MAMTTTNKKTNMAPINIKRLRRDARLGAEADLPGASGASEIFRSISDRTRFKKLCVKESVSLVISNSEALRSRSGSNEWLQYGQKAFTSSTI